MRFGTFLFMFIPQVGFALWGPYFLFERGSIKILPASLGAPAEEPSGSSATKTIDSSVWTSKIGRRFAAGFTEKKIEAFT